MIVTVRLLFDAENAAQNFMRELDERNWGETSKEIFTEQ